jgi:hypothetical protein
MDSMDKNRKNVFHISGCPNGQDKQKIPVLEH